MNIDKLPGFTSLQPMPHATIPDWKYRSNFPGTGQTNGEPPSPLQVSFPASPPAQIKLRCKLKRCPSLVRRNRSWQGVLGMIGKSIFFKIT